MKKIILLSALVSTSFMLEAQGIYFQQVTPLPPAPQNIADFPMYSTNAFTFADIDGDNDQDILLIGMDSLNDEITQLYTNDGSGNYFLVAGTPFTGVFGGAIALADIDGDNDPDVLISGKNNFGIPISELYTNDGSGNFTLVAGTPFIGIYNGSVAFADIDGDNDQDLLLTGISLSNNADTKLYVNNGTGNFTYISGTPFTDVSRSSIAFADIDGDNDQDVLITGESSSSIGTSELYLNDGLGNFTIDAGAPFTGVSYSSMAFADIDGDNDQDVLITGESSSSIGTSELYFNDGAGNFTLDAGAPFTGVYSGSIKFADIDSDNDQDVIITGFKNSNDAITELFVNDGVGNYVLNTGTSFPGYYYSLVTFADIDGDNDQDLFIEGRLQAGGFNYKLCINDGLGNFTFVSKTPFTALFLSSSAFADIDGDNDQDVIISGRGESNNLVTELYSNDGLGNYTLATGVSFIAQGGKVNFVDLDGDNDQDLIVSGYFYTNDGFGNFTLVVGTNYIGFTTFADIDGDSDQDLLVVNSPSSNLYTNDGIGNFTLVQGTNLIATDGESVAFSDIDGDNDQDLLITNSTNSLLYTNDGLGNFSLVQGTPFESVFLGSIAFADIDGDNDQDLLITGQNNLTYSSKLYINDGVGNFSLVTDTPFPNVSQSYVSFTDLDEDNDQDLIITGIGYLGQVTNLYSNNGSGGFTLVTGTPFTGVCLGSVAYADIDGDNDQDVFIMGQNRRQNISTLLFRNIITCLPDGIIDNQTACHSYTWMDGITYTASNDTATYILTNVSGCDSIITLNLKIISPNILVTQNGVTLTSQLTGATYRWLDCTNGYSFINGSTNQSFFAVSNGNYAVEVTQNGCTDTSACYSITTTGINENNKSTYKLYPNPTNNKLTIEGQEAINKIEVYNLTGQLLQSIEPKSAVIEINFTAYEQGVYLVKVHTENGQISTERVVRD